LTSILYELPLEKCRN